MAVYSAGFDFGSSSASFAVLEDGAVLFDRSIPLPQRNASELPRLMSDILLDFNLTFEDISQWSVGAGPGSFTGLRIAAAFVAGLVFRKDVKTRGVSSAAALAHTVFPDGGEPVLTLYDGRKNELLGFGLKYVNGSYEEDGFQTVVRNESDLAKLRASYSRFAALSADKEAVRAVCPVSVALIDFAERLHAASLVCWNPDDFTRPMTELTYLRPAVFVPPAAVRTDL
ncbi:MAG: tRNA (adenosine(37)-N6)-threonylcarbamoyltransferase complex dimerization subunit type 1 TsaB [Lentisphaeria bacterium]|nr:tRNA (adenosine(37)-N6)-threonylcarbamoyltransferase complex dimerization subunit type 1 TsaB [Lentisphaeria bacterium]